MLLIVHSCKGREWVLDYWWRFFIKNAPAGLFRVHEITDDRGFSDQLIEAVESHNDRYLWYTLDDYWIVRGFNYKHFWDVAEVVDCLRLQPNVVAGSLPYRFDDQGAFLRQLPSSPYHFSAATSIWDREYLLRNLTPGLDPWELEKTPFKHFGQTYFVPSLPFWYIDAVRRGVITDKGNEALNDLYDD